MTRELSVRGNVRIAAVSVDGTPLNDYSQTVSLDDDAPVEPWAMNLADVHGRYWYLGFDLDAGKGNAAYDAGRLRHWLDELNIQHLTCISGPTGGRHVWIALSEGAPAELVGSIALLAQQLLPSLDITPLRNPATGCMRPPGAPHRSGGQSEPQASIDTLIARDVDVDQLQELRLFLIDAGASIEPPLMSLVKGMAHDADRHPHLLGAKRAVSARIRALLNAAPDDNTSRTLAAVLVGCARARWRYADVLALLDTSPALEHARTRYQTVGERIPRPRAQSLKLLAADWERCVYFAASNDLDYEADDEDFQDRANTVGQAVERCQERADAMPGRWGLDGASRAQRAAQGRFSHRLVLDAVCLYLAQSAGNAVEVDTRRLATDTGYGRETCRLALLALATPDVDGDPESAWLVRVTDSHGVHGARYRLSKRFSTEADESKWAQADMRPPTPRLTGTALRTWWLNQLGSRFELLAHDTFAAPRSLGRLAGRLYSHLPDGGHELAPALARTAGLTSQQTRRALHRLHQAGLAHRVQGGWQRSPLEVRDVVAIALGVDGYLLERNTRYTVERGVWAWWQAEHTWMRTRRKKRRGRRAPTGVALFAQNDRPEFPRYPRDRTGQPDHQMARTLVETGIMSPAPIALAA